MSPFSDGRTPSTTRGAAFGAPTIICAREPSHASTLSAAPYVQQSIPLELYLFFFGTKLLGNSVGCFFAVKKMLRVTPLRAILVLVERLSVCLSPVYRTALRTGHLERCDINVCQRTIIPAGVRIKSYLKVLDDVEPSVANVVAHYLLRHRTRRADTETEASHKRGEGAWTNLRGAMEMNERPPLCAWSQQHLSRSPL